MELKRIEMVGFKSFPEKIKVEFGEGITAIVGPNGSGKSNIADAVRWVLGEQSAKSLRGSKMEDVIFAGTARRKPLGFAQVTLVLDNRDHKMALDYDEVAISRRIFRSGESEYLINNGRCRLRDVQELLMDTGIGKDGYSLIGQGQIDQLLSSKPQDRRAIFEEASGITKYKTRRDQATKQLQDEAMRLTRVTDILGELELRLEPLRLQAEVAEKYLALREELKLYEVSAFIGEYDQLKAQCEKVQGMLEDLLSQIESSRSRQEEAKEATARLGREADEKRSQLMELSRLVNELRISLESKEGDLRLFQQQAEHYETEKEDLTKRLEDTNDRLKERRNTLKKQQEKLSELNTKALSMRDGVTKRQEAVQKIQNQNEEALEKEEGVRRQLDELTRRQIEVQAENERSRLMVDQDKEQHQSFQEERSRLKEDIRSDEEELKKAEESTNLQLEKENEIRSALSEGRRELAEKEEEIRSLSSLQNEKVVNLKSLQDRLNWLEGMEAEYQGFSAPVKALMKSGASSGIRGTVAELIKVPRPYLLALDTALGVSLQNVVVDTDQDAKKCIAYLREKKLGRATFLPVKTVVGRSESKEKQTIEAMEGVIGFAPSLISYDPAYAKIISRLMGNLVLAKDFDCASKVSNRFGQVVRVVTLEGDIFNIGGAITGGSTQGKTAGILSRRGEKEALSESLEKERAKADELYRQLQEAREALPAKEEAVRGIETRLQEEEEKTALLKSNLEKSRFILETRQERLRELLDGNKELSSLVEKHEEKLKETGAALEQIQQEREDLTKEEARVRDELEKIGQMLEEERELLGKESLALAGTDQEKQFMSQSVEHEEMEILHLEEEAEALTSSLGTLEKEHKSSQSGQAKTEKEKERLIQEIEARSGEIEVQREACEETERLREESMARSEETLREFAALEKEQIRLEGQAQRAEKDLSELSERMWDEYEITYTAALELAKNGFNDDEDLRAASELSKTRRRQNISRLKSEIRALGSVNVDAIVEYKALTERVDFLTRQRDDIVASEANLQEVIAQMTRQMEIRFKKGFAAIRESFNQVFQQMFGGGQGLLELAEGADALEAGIEIIAQPPGKKLQNMMLLSGGERALTAIALLFAIQQLNPAPFCILDEIEAALDDANVSRFAEYLQDMTDHTQFIVITHRKGTMAAADMMYGVTMEEKGVSKCISVKFEEEG